MSRGRRWVDVELGGVYSYSSEGGAPQREYLFLVWFGLFTDQVSRNHKEYRQISADNGSTRICSVSGIFKRKLTTSDSH